MAWLQSEAIIVIIKYVEATLYPLHVYERSRCGVHALPDDPNIFWHSAKACCHVFIVGYVSVCCRDDSAEDVLVSRLRRRTDKLRIGC